MNLPKRKPNRLPGFDYSTPGAYFITICTQNRKPILGKIVGGGNLDAPKVHLSKAGTIARRYILSANQILGLSIDKFVIMPNHIHLIVMVMPNNPCGTSRSPSPTNAQIPRFVSSFKRLCHQELGNTIFQRSYHDHVIRNDADYLKIWQYIDDNPTKWEADCFYCKEESP